MKGCWKIIPNSASESLLSRTEGWNPNSRGTECRTLAGTLELCVRAHCRGAETQLVGCGLSPQSPKAAFCSAVIWRESTESHAVFCSLWRCCPGTRGHQAGKGYGCICCHSAKTGLWHPSRRGKGHRIPCWFMCKGPQGWGDCVCYSQGHLSPPAVGCVCKKRNLLKPVKRKHGHGCILLRTCFAEQGKRWEREAWQSTLAAIPSRLNWILTTN